VVRARLSPVGDGLQVLVYAPDHPGLFATLTDFLDRQQFTVAEAKVYTTSHGYALDTFQVLAQARGQESPRDLVEGIERGLAARLAEGAPRAGPPSGRVSRWVKHFPIAPTVSIRPRRRNGGWQVFVSCADRPGLLSLAAQVFLRHELNLEDARITTLGARAEDTFELTGPALESDAGRQALAQDLEKALAA
jgi:[protein-PII] uridylyltransferase